MKKNIRFPFARTVLSFGLLSMVLVSCKNRETNPEKLNETIVTGTATILVDETIKPIVEDEATVFESQYRAKINLITKPESEVVNDLINDKAQIAILSRTLKPEEQAVFNKKQIVPRITKFAVDAVALITSAKTVDTLVDLKEVIALMQGKKSKVGGLVFENSNSSTVKYMSKLAEIKTLPKDHIYALKSHSEVFKYISTHPGLIGVVGLNTIVQPIKGDEKYLNDIEVMSVRDVSPKAGSNEYYKPSQSNLADELYPLQRDLYMLNYQGIDGLGMGFASFIAGEVGQRIILKSGLMPVRTPGRMIITRKGILNTKTK